MQNLKKIDQRNSPLGGAIGKTLTSICGLTGNRKWIKFYTKEGLGGVYRSPEGHCPPTPRGSTPNFRVFGRIWGWVPFGFTFGKTVEFQTVIPIPISLVGIRILARLGEIRKFPIGGSHGPPKVTLFLVFLANAKIH